METNSAPSSAYLLLLRDSPDCYASISAEERQQLLQQWNAWYDGLAAEGKVLHGQPLEPQGRVVSATRSGRVIDGPFVETKEIVAGYFLLTVDSLEEATGIAKQCPSLRHGMVVEVRPIAGACAPLGVHGRPPAAQAATA